MRTLARLVAPLVVASIASPAAAATFFFDDTPYLSAADIPDGLYLGGTPTALEDFEDGTLDFGITVSGGRAIPPGRVDSVDADDGVIDGSGTAGVAWFIEGGAGTAELVFTFPGLPTAGRDRVDRWRRRSPHVLRGLRTRHGLARRHRSVRPGRRVQHR